VTVTARTKVVGTDDQLRYVDVTRPTWYWRHAVVSGRKSRAGEYTGNHVTGRVAAAAYATSVQSPVGTDYSVASDQLYINHHHHHHHHQYQAFKCCQKTPSCNPPGSCSSQGEVQTKIMKFCNFCFCGARSRKHPRPIV